jgi:cell division protein FtsQ
MDRSRPRGPKGTAAPSARPPAASRLTVRARRNRRKPGALWTRLPDPKLAADACGRALRRAVPALAAAAALAVVGGGVFAGYRFLTRSPRFAITAIEIRGTHRLGADDVRAILPVHLGDNVFAANLDRVARGLTVNPWIASAEAHRVLPHTLVVEIHERTPAALVDLGGLYLVDGGGHPFKRAAIDAGEGEGLPVITGLDRDGFRADPEASAGVIRQTLTALTAWQATGARPAIGELHVDGHRALTLHTYDQATAIQLGPLDPEQLGMRIETFDAAWAQLTEAERHHARAIHLDARSDNVTVAFAKD